MYSPNETEICSKPFLSSRMQPKRDTQRSVTKLFFRPVYSPDETDRDLFQTFSISIYTAHKRQTEICSKPFLSPCIQPRQDRKGSVANLFYRPVYSPGKTDRDLLQTFSIALYTAQARQTGICSKPFLSPCIQPRRDRQGSVANLFYRPVYSLGKTDRDLLQTFSISIYTAHKRQTEICSKPFLSPCIQPRQDRQGSVANLFYLHLYSP